MHAWQPASLQSAGPGIWQAVIGAQLAGLAQAERGGARRTGGEVEQREEK